MPLLLPPKRGATFSGASPPPQQPRRQPHRQPSSTDLWLSQQAFPQDEEVRVSCVCLSMPFLYA